MMDIHASMAIVVDGRPISTFEGDGMTSFLRVLNPCYPPPNYNKAGSCITELAALCRSEISNLFRGAKGGWGKMSLSVDGWESPQGNDMVAVCADMVNPLTFEVVSAVIACKEMSSIKTSSGLADFLKEIVCDMDVDGWTSLESAASSITTDSAPNMLGVAAEVPAQSATISENLSVPPIGSSILVYQDGSPDDVGFWDAVVVGVSIGANGGLETVEVHWLNDQGQLEGLATVRYPWWGTASADDAKKMSGAPHISFTEAISGYELRVTSKIFGTASFVKETSIPGIMSLPCYPHLVSTVLSVVVEKKRSNLGFGDLFVPRAEELISRVIKIATHIHYMGAARSQLYERCRKAVEDDFNSTMKHPRCPLHCPTRWFSVVPVLEYYCNVKYMSVISIYITSFNRDDVGGKAFRGSSNLLPTLNRTDQKDLKDILNAIKPYQSLNETLQTDRICFGGAALILECFISARTAAPPLLSVVGEPSVGETVRLNLLNALRAKIKRTNSTAHQLIRIAAQFLTPACAKITYNTRGKSMVMNALTFVDSIFKSENMLEKRREEARGDAAGFEDEDGGGGENMDVSESEGGFLERLFSEFTKTPNEMVEETQLLDERIGIKENMEKELVSYLRLAPEMNDMNIGDQLSKVTAAEYWKVNGHGLFRLSFLSAVLMSIKLSSADTERVFSNSGDVSRGKRGGISAKRIEELVLISKNRELLLKNSRANTEEFWRQNIGSVRNAKSRTSVRSKNYVSEGAQRTGLWTADGDGGIAKKAKGS